MVKEEAEEVITGVLHLPLFLSLKATRDEFEKWRRTVSYKIPDNRTINYYRHLATTILFSLKTHQVRSGTPEVSVLAI